MAKAVKKSELYSSLWDSCDQLRGSMDASQYKDYVLTLLFVKYVSDKATGNPYEEIVVPDGGSFVDMVALKNKPNIGEGMDKIIGKLAEANGLQGVITNAHFNDDAKLGRGKEKVDTLTKLIGIFQRPELDFSRNGANDDDLIGDAYEYLMRSSLPRAGRARVSSIRRPRWPEFLQRWSKSEAAPTLKQPCTTPHAALALCSYACLPRRLSSWQAMARRRTTPRPDWQR